MPWARASRKSLTALPAESEPDARAALWAGWVALVAVLPACLRAVCWRPRAWPPFFAAARRLAALCERPEERDDEPRPDEELREDELREEDPPELELREDELREEEPREPELPDDELREPEPREPPRDEDPPDPDDELLERELPPLPLREEPLD